MQIFKILQSTYFAYLYVYKKGKVCPRLLGADRSTIWQDHNDNVFNPSAGNLLLHHKI